MCKERNIDENGTHLQSVTPSLPPGHTYDDGVIDVKTQKKLFTCTLCGAREFKPLTSSDFLLISNLKYTVTKNGTLAFAGAINTKSRLTIPDTVTYNGNVFKVTEVEDNALKGNKKVTHIVIGKNITTIGKRAFSGCTKLKSVTIGKNVKMIEPEAFKGCRNLKNITIQSTKLALIGNNILKGIHPKAKIKVPAKKLKNYQVKLKKKGQKPTVKIIA